MERPTKFLPCLVGPNLTLRVQDLEACSHLRVPWLAIPVPGVGEERLQNIVQDLVDLMVVRRIRRGTYGALNGQCLVPFHIPHPHIIQAFQKE